MDSLSSILAVVFVLALLAGTLALLRSRGNAVLRLPGTGGPGRQLEVLERVTMGPGHALHLVRVGGRKVLVATSPGGCQFLPEGEPGL